MIYYFCGHRGSGKNYLANQISNRVPIEIIDTGPTIRKVYGEHNEKKLSFKDWMAYYENKYGKDFSNMIICKSTQIDLEKNYIVIGYRSLEGIEYFNQFFAINQFKIIFIDGDLELFKNNYNKREKTNFTTEDYQKIVEIEELMGINKLREFVKNNQRIGEYYYKKQNDSLIYNSIIGRIEEMER